MGNKKTFRFFGAWGVIWGADQCMAGAKPNWQSAPKGGIIVMKAGHLVRAPFGNDRVRNEPWMIRCFRHANVFEVAE